MHSMLSNIDAAEAAKAAQLLEGELASRELLQAIVDKISGLPLQTQSLQPNGTPSRSPALPLTAQCISRNTDTFLIQISSHRRGQTRACARPTTTTTCICQQVDSG